MAPFSYLNDCVWARKHMYACLHMHIYLLGGIGGWGWGGGGMTSFQHDLDTSLVCTSNNLAGILWFSLEIKLIIVLVAW